LEAIAKAVEEYEREKERLRDQKQTSRREAAERERMKDLERLREQEEQEAAAKAESAVSTPKAASRTAAFFSRKATPISSASTASSPQNGAPQKDWKPEQRAGRKDKPFAVPIEPVTLRPARKPAVLVVPRRLVNGAGRGGAATAVKAEAANGGAPTSPSARASAQVSKKKGFGRQPCSAPTTPNGRNGVTNDSIGLLVNPSSLLGKPTDAQAVQGLVDKPAPPARLYAQVQHPYLTPPQRA
jgi:hypothetical protein